eukprot:361525-Chlamydomonas_euryale.AAC.13
MHTSFKPPSSPQHALLSIKKAYMPSWLALLAVLLLLGHHGGAAIAASEHSTTLHIAQYSCEVYAATPSTAEALGLPIALPPGHGAVTRRAGVSAVRQPRVQQPGQQAAGHSGLSSGSLKRGSMDDVALRIANAGSAGVPVGASLDAAAAATAAATTAFDTAATAASSEPCPRTAALATPSGRPALRSPSGGGATPSARLTLVRGVKAPATQVRKWTAALVVG